MNDLHAALAAERSRTLLSEAQYERLTRLARTSSPSRLAAGAARFRAAREGLVHWLRAGQLAGYPSTCQTC